MNKRILMGIVLVLGLILGIGLGTSTVYAQSTDYQVDITVSGGGTESYNVAIYHQGAAYPFTNQSVTPNSTATFSLADGDYQYTVSRGQTSARQDFVVDGAGLSLTYSLATINITVSGGGSDSYTVNVYAEGAAWGFDNASLTPGNTATFYDVGGDYQYTVSRGRTSDRQDFRGR